MNNKNLSSYNRKAKFDYTILEEYEAGIKLVGPEVKSLRLKGCNITDAFCYNRDNEIYVKGIFIPKHKESSYYNHEEKRDRKLLLHKKQIRDISKMCQENGVTIVPLSLYLNERGIFKLKIAVCKGKKLYDKRNTIKERDIKREMERG